MSPATTASRFTSAIPFLPVADVDEAARFYVQTLGFTIDWTWGTPTSDAGLRRDGLSLYLTRNPDLAARVRGFEVVLMVANIDAAYEEHRRNGAPIAEALEPKPWGTREYRIDDPTGYRLRITEVGEEGS
jgi:catechol 2,3-dioxygenase-like lactoylglutathione lyase family enzyme